jgi:hypothetical protein
MCACDALGEFRSFVLTGSGKPTAHSGVEDLYATVECCSVASVREYLVIRLVCGACGGID